MAFSFLVYDIRKADSSLGNFLVLKFNIVVITVNLAFWEVNDLTLLQHEEFGENDRYQYMI